MQTLAMRSVFTPVRPQFATCLLLLAVAVAMLGGLSGCDPSEEQSESNHGIHLWPVEWTHNDEPFYGIAAQGSTLHGVNSGAGSRPIKILLMPMGKMVGDKPEDPALVYQTPVMEAPDGKYIAIDLRHGAAMSELGEGSAVAGLPRVKAVLEAVELRSARNLPGVSDKQFEPWLELIVKAGDIRWSEGGDKESFVQSIRTASSTQKRNMEQAAIEAAYAFWPMIFSFTVAAGSESTQVILVSLPGSAANTNSVLARLIEGNTAKLSIDSNSQPVIMNLNTNHRTDIENGTPNSKTPDEDDDKAVKYAQEALEAGWEEVFGSGQDTP